MQIRIYLILMMALMSVSSTALVIRYLEDLNPILLAFWRMLFASILLWIYSSNIKSDISSYVNKAYTVIAGVFLGLHFAFFFIGVRNTSIPSATLLACTAPIFTAVISWLRGEYIGKTALLGLSLSILGIMIVQSLDNDLSRSNLYGNLLSLLSGFCIAITFIFAKKIRLTTENVIYGREVFFIASLTLLAFSIFTKVSLFSFSKADLPWFLFLGLFPSILGHNMLNYTIKYLSPTAVASVPLGEPIIASLFSYLIFFEPVPFGVFVGAPFIFFGIFLLVKQSN